MADSWDAVLVGGGIMSATLGTLLKKLEPASRIAIVERLDRPAAESSDAWNNAGTGHAGFCELNYTPQRSDGSVDVSKALHIGAQFAQSLEWWSALLRAGDLEDSRAFIRAVPHLSVVWGDEGIAYLRARHAELVRAPLFADMELSSDLERIAEWAPLLLEGRGRRAPMAATRAARGADVDFGALTRGMIASLERQPEVNVRLSTEVVGLGREGSGWRLRVRGPAGEDELRARFVFLGAGGYTLSLLEESGIPEAAGYGAFPVSGQWLRCTNPAIIERHHAKVYGKAEVGAPPMSVPHLDTRIIEGQRGLLFGPYAGFTTKFLKEGSWLDLLRSIGIHNVTPMVSVGLTQFELTRYLVGQVLLSAEERLAALRRFFPAADAADWEPLVAGLRVQIIKRRPDGSGELKFGTEVVTSADGTLAGLLGASPGASTAVSIMLELLERCFPDRWRSAEWTSRRRGLLPSCA